MSDPLRPHGLKHTRLPCPSPTPGACSISCPSSLRRHPTISSSVIPFSSSLQSSPSSGPFLMSQFFVSGDQNTGVSASSSILNIRWKDLGEAEAPILRPYNAKSRLTGKDPDTGNYWGQEEKGMTEDEMVGWHHWLNGHEFEQTPGNDEGQGIWTYCSPWGHKELAPA